MTFVNTWRRQIEEDLTPFIDPGSRLSLDIAGSIIRASWVQRRVEVRADFTIRDIADISVETQGKVYDYRTFFASDLMSDLFGIAKSTSQIHCSDGYVETLAEFLRPDGATEVGSATELVAKLALTKLPEEELTNFVMVTGEAGAGKTSVLKELVARQAESYLKGAASFVYLYVDAQGRALARFNEALALELNELRVNLPIHAIPPMVRLGLIVPVVDGFDELIGAGGYDDSFSSISSFVESLFGKGAIVASARSTYYEQEFLSRASRTKAFRNQAWKLASIEVKAWGDEELRAYASQRVGGDVQETDGLVLKLKQVFSGENEPLAKKPLFVAKVADLLSAGERVTGEGRLLEQLMNAFLSREQHDKLLNKGGRPILTTAQLRALCSDLAEEMWLLGTRELDRVTVRELTEIAMSDLDASPGDKTTVIDRMPNMAFLMKGESVGSVAFEHELFFDLFLAGRIASKISGANPGVSETLSRSAMPESLAESIAQSIAHNLSASASNVLGALCKAGGTGGPRQQVVRENAGRIIASFVVERAQPIVEEALRNVTFPGSRLNGVEFIRTQFENVEFKRTDLVGTKFVACQAVGNLYFELPRLSSNTRLEIAGVTPGDSFIGIRVADDSVEGGATYDPTVIERELRLLGLPALQHQEEPMARDVADGVLKIVSRLARAYSKCNPICEQDEYLGGIFSNSHWSEIRKAAIANGILKEEVRPAHGSRRNFYRIQVSPEELALGAIRGADVADSVKEFWRELEREFPGGFPADSAPG